MIGFIEIISGEAAAATQAGRRPFINYWIDYDSLGLLDLLDLLGSRQGLQRAALPDIRDGPQNHHHPPIPEWIIHGIAAIGTIPASASTHAARKLVPTSIYYLLDLLGFIRFIGFIRIIRT